MRWKVTIKPSCVPGDGPSLPAGRSTAELKHIPALDGIRGIAILMVLTYHLLTINAAGKGAIFVWYENLRKSLWCGVDVFFALSGFLITGILIRTVTSQDFFRSFYVRRALRIFPLYYACLFLLFACTPLLHIHWAGQQWRLLTYTNNIWLNTHASGFSFNFGNGVNLTNFWSLHVEEQFYLVWPFLVFFVRAPRRLIPMAVLFSLGSFLLRIWLSHRGVDHAVLYSSFITRSDNLFLGAVLALLLQTRYRAATIRFALPVFVVTMLTLIGIFIEHHGWKWEATSSDFLFSSQFTLFAIATISLIALCLDKGSVFARICSTRVLRFFGTYSYGLYIYHTIVPIFVGRPLSRWLQPYASHTTLCHFVATVVEVGLTIVISVLSYNFFEKPILRLKKKFAYIPKAVVAGPTGYVYQD
jgi:peptidoglycan/LPS O-acetylase OafA/YrhL